MRRLGRTGAILAQVGKSPEVFHPLGDFRLQPTVSAPDAESLASGPRMQFGGVNPAGAGGAHPDVEGLWAGKAPGEPLPGGPSPAELRPHD